MWIGWLRHIQNWNFSRRFFTAGLCHGWSCAKFWRRFVVTRRRLKSTNRAPANGASRNQLRRFTHEKVSDMPKKEPDLKLVDGKEPTANAIGSTPADATDFAALWDDPQL